MIRRILAVAVAAALVALAPASPARSSRAAVDNWYVDFLRLGQAHGISQGDGVTVALIDSGIDATHPDLAGSIIPGYNPDGIGAADGRSDTDGHGTAMAGLIVGHGGVLGIAPMAKVVPIRAGDTNAIAKAIDWAVAHGASVINISQAARIDTPGEAKAVSAALAAGVVIVAGAGNVPGSLDVDYPAAYDGVIAAAAVTPAGEHAAISVRGSKLVLAAPGESITSTAPGGTYSRGSGTSNASAIIAGVAALVKAKYPNLSGKEIYHRLVATADDKGPPGRDSDFGYGIVNPVRALTENVPPLAESPTPNPEQDLVPGDDAAPGDDNLVSYIVIFGLVALLFVGAMVTLIVVLSRRRT